MKSKTIGKNNFVAEISWRRDNSALYKRSSAISKDARRDGFTYAVPCGFKFKQFQITGYGFVQESDEARKFSGRPVLAALIASKAPNCLAIFPIDHRGEELAIMIIHGGVPIKDLIIPTSSLPDMFEEIYQEFFTDGDLFSDVERPGLYIDSSLEKLRPEHQLHADMQRIKSRVEAIGFILRVEDIYSDLQDKAPSSVRLRQYKGVNTKIVAAMVAIIGVAGVGYYFYMAHQAEIEEQARRAAQAAMIARLSGNEEKVSQSDIEKAMEQIENRVNNKVLQAYIVNTGSNYPKEWPLRILELADSVPPSIGGFVIRSISCSTIRTRCDVIFTRGEYGVSVSGFTSGIENSEFMSNWSVDPNRASARAHIRFNEGNTNIDYSSFASLNSFVDSAIQLSDLSEKAINSFEFDPNSLTVVIQTPESIEFRGQIQGDDDRRLVEDKELPADWISIQRVNISGSNRPGIRESMTLTSIDGFGFTEFVLEFDDRLTVNKFELSGSMIRRDTSRNRTGRTIQ